jgi:hypothetical protein
MEQYHCNDTNLGIPAIATPHNPQGKEDSFRHSRTGIPVQPDTFYELPITEAIRSLPPCIF